MIYLCNVPSWDELEDWYDLLSDFYTSHTPPQAVTPLSDLKGPITWLFDLLFRFRPHSWPQGAGRNRRLLDVGCGNGARLIEFAERGWQVFGTDVSTRAIDAARRTVPNGVFLEGELEAIDLPPESFDIIRMDNVLEHVPEPEPLLHRCRELLNPQGRLYVYVPHGRSLSVRVLGKYAYSALTPIHLNLFTVSTLRRILSRAGFSCVDIVQFCPYSWIPGSLKLFLGIQKLSLPRVVDRGLMLLLSPVGYIASRVGWGEELVAISRR
jgi:SAM-dependent methyltransferase